MRITPINKGFLLIGLTIVFILTLITYVPWEHSNYHGLPDSLIGKLAVRVFDILTLPFGYMSEKFFKNELSLLSIILMTFGNIFIYGIIIERLLTLFINKKRN